MTKQEFIETVRKNQEIEGGDTSYLDNEADCITDLAEDGWPDCEKWSAIWCEVNAGRELTSEERRKALVYWKAGEQLVAEEDRI